ncbi:hypothetical protein [Lacinutrix salivirga]
MKKLINFTFVFAIILFGCGSAITSSKASKKDCRSFKTGKFIIEDEAINHTSVIIRNDSIQYEKDINTNHSINFKINWINDCLYTLIPINPKDEEGLVPPEMLNKRLFVQIDSIKNDIQYFTSYLEGYESSKLSGAIKKLE